MSHALTHKQIEIVLRKARELDISKPDPQAIYDAGSGGFQIWCTPQNNPGGEWTEIRMTAGAFAKPAEFVASVLWKWEGKQVSGLVLTTSAYTLRDRFPNHFVDPADDMFYASSKESIHNRAPDLTWAGQQIEHPFALAAVPCPPIELART